MTGIDPSGRPAGGRGRAGLVILALSLTLNVFFVAGLIWTRTMDHAPPLPAVERFEKIAKDTNLAGDQLAAFEQFDHAFRERQHQLREQNRPIAEAIWTELAKPQPDQDKISGLIEQAGQNRRAAQMDNTAALTAFLAALSPDQRARFADLAQRRHP
ncbi:MAG TPA: periplasmic heavy metal sensor [Stellaceae bacterium]|nr:periplasmic heavy metal sensor [Stellaceae bacterium]